MDLAKDFQKRKVWAETANTATDHEVMIVYPGESMSSFARCLRTFGEIVIM